MATVPSITTQSAGGTATAAYANTLKAAIDFFSTNRPRVLLRQTVAQSIPNNTWTALTFDTEDFDNDGGHSTVTNTSRYTAQTAGYYWVGGGGATTTSGTAQRGVRWAVNGSAVNGTRVQFTASSAGGTGIPARSMYVYLNASDYLTLEIFQNSGGALNTQISTADEQSTLHAWWAGV